MSEPTAFMPFYGNDFFQAVTGQPDIIVASYMRALWHYWNHEKCGGLKDDREYLRLVCRVDKADWPHVMSVVFDNEKFFTLENDLHWHQKRALEEWIKARKAYEAACARTAKATKTRWKTK